MGDLAPVLVLIVIFAGIIGIIRAGSDVKIRKDLIARGMVDDKVLEALSKPSYTSNNLNNLKWGMVLMAIGLAVLLSRLLPWDMDDGGTIGLIFILAGLAFLAYYPIAKSYERNKTINAPHP